MKTRRGSYIIQNSGFEDNVEKAKTTADFCLDKSDSYYIEDLNEKSEVIVAKFPANTALKVDGQNNKSIEAYVVLPAATYSDVEVYLYMADGKVYSNSEKKEATVEANRNKIKRLEVTLEAAGNAPYVVTSEEDWNRYVALVEKGKKNEKFTIAGENFSLSNNAKYPTAEGASVTVNGNLKISGDNVTMANVIAGTITVLEGAKLNVNDQITAEEIINEGEVVLKKVVDADQVVQEIKSVNKIANKGTLKVEAAAKAVFELSNQKDAVVENNGVITVNGNNFGIINNNAKMNTKGFTNESREYKGTKLVNIPTINNVKGANILAEEGKLLNKAVIVNSGVLTCKNSAGTIGNGADVKEIPVVLDSKAGAITYITDNEEGKVIVYSANTTNLTIAGKDGIVEYTTTKTSESFKNSLVNTVIASDDLKITEGDIASLTFTDNATLELGKKDNAFIAFVGKLIVDAGRTTLGTDLTLETVEVKKNAMVVVPEKLTMTITGSAIKNEGTILVGGEFIAESIQKDAEGNGNVEDNGGDSQITWGEVPATPEEEAKAKFKAAMEEFVNTWIENSNYAKGTWASVTLENIAIVKWGENTASTKEWVKTARQAFVEAYNEYWGPESNLTIEGIAKAVEADKEGFINAAIATAKEAVTSEIIAATIKAEITDNSWIGSSVYERNAATVKVLDIPNLKAGFVTAVKAIKKSETVKNAVVLSLADFKEADVTENMIPVYSYIGTYKGATEYDVMVALTGFTADWYKKDGTTAFTKDNLKTLADVQKAAALIYDTYYDKDANLGIQEKTAIEKLNILDKVTTILEWEYTDKQIAALAGKMQ